MPKIKMNMKPSHPGSFIQDEILDHHGLSVSEGAKFLGVRRASLSDLINEKTRLSPEMAMRVEMVFGLKAEGMLQIQAMYDAYEARQQAGKLKVKQYVPQAA